MEEMLQYMRDLENNNERPWFHQTAARRKEVLASFQSVIGILSLSLSQFDSDIGFPDPKSMVYSIVRDVRYTRDKTPYNPSLRAHIAAGGKMPIPTGYFIKIMPGDRSFLGGGLFMHGLRSATDLVREQIDNHGDRLEQILGDPEFARYFTLHGETLVNVPKPYDPGHAYGNLLRHKSWYVQCPLEDETVKSPDFIEIATRIFQVMRPFKEYMNEALEGFTYPKDW